MRITLIGSGNVATHLAAAFKNAGHRLVQVYSPNMQNAAILAYHVGATAIDKLEDISAKQTSSSSQLRMTRYTKLSPIYPRLKS
jgi:predicted dehydrogenase